MAHLLYATPTGKSPKIQYVQSMRAMELGIRSFGVRRAQDFIFGGGPVQMARSRIADAALMGRCFKEHDCKANEGKDCVVEPYDYLLMHDDDLMVDPTNPIGSPIDSWHEIFKANPEVGVIGAIYLRESLEIPNVVVKHPTNTEEVCHAVARYPNGPFECAGVATGFMMIRRECLEKLASIADDEGGRPMFRFEERRRSGGTMAEDGEDYNFCKRVTAAGFKVIADPRFDTIHVKDTGHLAYSYEAWERKWAEPANEQESAALKVTVDHLRAQMAPLMEIGWAKNGCMILDHTKQLEADTAAWRKRVEDRRGKAAA